MAFSEYVERARGVLKDANRRKRERPKLLPVGAGFDPKVRRAFRNEFPQHDDEAVEIRWQWLQGDDFFMVDREYATLWLNTRYRQHLLGGRRAGLNDLPVLKALLFLLIEQIFAGQNLGPRDKDNLDAWQAVLTAAAKAESS